MSEPFKSYQKWKLSNLARNRQLERVQERKINQFIVFRTENGIKNNPPLSDIEATDTTDTPS